VSYREVFDTLTLMTLITLTVISFIQARTIRSLSRTNQSTFDTVQAMRRGWTHYAWRVHDVAAAAGLQLPRPPHPRIPIPPLPPESAS
jgi:hypothetical protein